MKRIRRRDIAAVIVTCAGLALTGAIVATTAAYTDEAKATLDIAGTLDISAVQNGIELEGNPDAVKIVTSGAAEVGFVDPIMLEFEIRNKTTSADAEVRAALFDPDPGELVASRFPDLYDQVLFTITDQDAPGGPSVLVNGLSAQEIATNGVISLGSFPPGETHRVTVSMLLEPTTRSIYNGTKTAVGLTLTGVSQ